MPLDPQAFSAVIKAELSAVAPATNDAELTKFCNAIAKAVVEYLILATNVVVDPSTFTGKLT